MCKFEVRKVDSLGLCIDCKYHVNNRHNTDELEGERMINNVHQKTHCRPLVDITADVLIQNPDTISTMTSHVDEGVIFWTYLLKAWYRSKQKRIPASASTCSTPKQKVISLMKI
jgi:hypothetical protein